MIIHEFWTFVTDVILAVLCFFYAYRLRSTMHKADSSAKIWRPIFISIGLAALSGAIHHGFKPYLPLPVFNSLRILVLFCLSGTAYMIGLSLLRFSLSRESKIYKYLNILLSIKLGIFLVVAYLQTHFLVGVADYGSTFVVALIVFAMNLDKPASKLMISAIIVSLVAAAIQVLKISPHPSFNHNDLYHVVQIFGLHLLYLGSPLLTDKSQS